MKKKNIQKILDLYPVIDNEEIRKEYEKPVHYNCLKINLIDYLVKRSFVTSKDDFLFLNACCIKVARVLLRINTEYDLLFLYKNKKGKFKIRKDELEYLIHDKLMKFINYYEISYFIFPEVKIIIDIRDNYEIFFYYPINEEFPERIKEFLTKTYLI